MTKGLGAGLGRLLTLLQQQQLLRSLVLCDALGNETGDVLYSSHVSVTGEQHLGKTNWSVFFVDSWCCFEEGSRNI